MALALAPQGISVTCVAPGFVQTEMAREVLDGPGGDAVRAQSPYGQVARPEEVASAVLWLASPGARYVTGTALVVDGGVLANQVPRAQFMSPYRSSLGPSPTV